MLHCAGIDDDCKFVTYEKARNTKIQIGFSLNCLTFITIPRESKGAAISTVLSIYLLYDKWRLH